MTEESLPRYEIREDAFVSAGGFMVPDLPWFKATLAEELARSARNQEAAAGAALAGETVYLEEGFLGATRMTILYPPPSRLDRIRRSLKGGRREALRRVREAALLLRTGETSYDADYDD